ncbi:MAG: discoidin domain-containing protein, partial [Dysgonamonadaceae bacterium]|nr:discoidin domain-containing protein [Dysgonamonadaceae bacterium]
VHEQSVKDIASREWIWGTFLWNMFDFASDNRNEGSNPGINDKGLITHDRRIKKDSYYVYKANWSHETTLYIASRRFVERTGESTPVTVYTNCDSVELLVNGVSKGVIKRNASNQGILIWDNVPLENKGAKGSDVCKNTVIAKGKRSGVEYADTVVWQRTLSSATNLSSTTLLIDNTNRKISLSSSVQAENINQAITPAAGATFVLVAADGVTPVTSGSVAPGMKLIVTPEDGITIAVYEFIIQHIAKGKSAKADSQENATNTPNKAVDGDITTRWAAPNNATPSAPHWLEVDLGKDYVINQVNVLWFDSESNHRAYQYTVQARKGNETANRKIADQSSNSTYGFVSSIVQDEIARHIRINSTGTKEGTTYNYTSICELQVYGWSITSNSYTIDYANHTINVPFSSEIIPETDFMNNLSFEGVQKYRKSGGAYYIMAGDSLFVTDSNGKETAFEILTSQTALSSVDANFQQVAVTNTQELIYIQLLKGASALLKISEPSGKRIVSQQIGEKFSYPLPQGIYLIEVDDNEKNSTRLKYILH